MTMPGLEKFHYQITGPRTTAETGSENHTPPELARVPKLVFLHGVMGFSANFRRIAKAFEEKFQVLVYDQRGHGRSFQPAQGYQAADYAGDLKMIIDELGWSQIALLGHSMGGRVALEFASQWPERLTQLVIEDIGPSMQPFGASFVLQLLDAVPVPFADRRAAKEWFDTVFMEKFKNLRHREGLAAYLYANLTENADRQAVWRFYEPGIRESVADGRADGHTKERWDEIRALKMPTLLVRGEHSSDLPRDLFLQVLAANSAIEGVEIKGAGHWIHADQPAIFIDVLRRFFEHKRQVAVTNQTELF